MLLLERDKQLALLARWHDAIGTRSGCVVLVTGEAGIGKTALVSEFLRRHAAEVRVLWGACDPLSTPQPLGPLRDVGRQVGGSLLEAVTQGTNRERIFAATIEELERPGKPVVLVMEDMHWADDATLDLLKYLGRRVGRSRAMIVATYRTDEIHALHPLQASIGLLPGDVVRRLPLLALSEDAIGELALTLGRSAAGIYAATAGNPFYVTELLAAPPGEIPTSVRDAVIARVARLSPAARKLAELVAVIPGHVEPWLIEAVLPATDAAVEECTLNGLMRAPDESLSFRHELSRRAVEDSLTPTQARALHAQVLRVMTEQRRRIDESLLVHHAVRADDVAAVLKFAPLAAERSAGVGAHREAIAYYRTALRHEARMAPAVRANMLDKLAYECFLTGEIIEAIDCRTQALDIWHARGDAMRAGDTMRWLSRLHWFRGRGDEAHRYAVQAVAALEPLGPSGELAMAFSNMSQLGMLASHDAQAIGWGEQAIALADQLGNDEILAHALNNVGAARLDEVGDAGWLELERSLELSLQRGLYEHVGRAFTNLATFAITNRDYRTGGTYVTRGLSFCGEHEFYMAEAYLRVFRARRNFEQGAWDAALDEAEELLRQPGLSVAARIPALTVVGAVRLRRGAENAREPLDEARELALVTGEPQRIIPVASACVEHAWLLGNKHTAIQDAHRALEYASRDRNRWRVGELMFWSWQAGAAIEGAVVAATPFQLQMAGDNAGSARAWVELGCPYERALALADSPHVEVRKEALEIFEKLGARPMAHRVRKQLAAQGVRGLKRGAHRSTRSNVAGLTRRELEVLALITRDLSNADIARRLYLSRKTVDHHASAILMKLNIGSRRQAADAARKLGIELIQKTRASGTRPSPLKADK